MLRKTVDKLLRPEAVAWGQQAWRFHTTILREVHPTCILDMHLLRLLVFHRKENLIVCVGIGKPSCHGLRRRLTSPCAREAISRSSRVAFPYLSGRAPW